VFALPALGAARAAVDGEEVADVAGPNGRTLSAFEVAGFASALPRRRRVAVATVRVPQQQQHPIRAFPMPTTSTSKANRRRSWRSTCSGTSSRPVSIRCRSGSRLWAAATRTQRPSRIRRPSGQQHQRLLLVVVDPCSGGEGVERVVPAERGAVHDGRQLLQPYLPSSGRRRRRQQLGILGDPAAIGHAGRR
jgi:hypothetical protein